MPFKSAKIIALFQLCKHAKGIYTSGRPGTYSSIANGSIANIVDNTVFGLNNALETSSELNPWINIQLSESGVIKSVALIIHPVNA
jgi:hypothetical protein